MNQNKINKNNLINKYEFLSNKINFLFRKLFNLKNHPFYLDLNHVQQINKEYDNYKKSKIKKKIKYQKLIEDLNDIPFDNKSISEEFDINLLKKLSIEMSKTNNFDKILKIINRLYYMDIPSNIKNLDKRLNHIAKDERINVLIVGGGPVGLFLACYLFNFYNTSFGLNNYPKVNIIVIDNRVTYDNKRKPYTRHRPFAFNSGFFSQIIPRIYSWDPKQSNGLFLNIYILEYVLFAKAYYEYSIPFLFEDMNWDSIKTIIKKGKIDVIFDCTGGNLKPPIFKDIDKEWIEKIKKDIPKDKNNPEILINKNNNLVSLNIENSQFPKDYYYGSIIVYKKDVSLDKNIIIFNNKFDLDINNIDDRKLLEKHKYKYYTYENIMKIISGITNDLERSYLYQVLEKYNLKSNNYIFKIEYFNTYLRHAIEISKVLEFKEHNCLYIGAGDTIFHSHFITGAGLNRTINFVAKCANFLLFLDLLD